MKEQVRGPFHPVRDIEIEAYLCGELDGASRGALEAELERNPKLQGWDTVRVKGNTLSADLFVKRGETVFRYRPGVPLHAGDRVRISIESPAAGYLSVFGRDARGQVSVYYSDLLTTPGRYTVPDSLILDGADGDEQWVLVHAADMQPIDRYVDAFMDGKDLDTPHAIIQLHKEAP